MLARKFSSDGEMRWPRPWRARNATSLPASFPTTYGSEGLPHGVSMVNSCCTSKPGIEYNPLPPIIPIVGFMPGVSCLDKFEQNAACRRRMDENVKVAAGARPRIVHQTRATGFETRDCAREVGYFDGDVMQPFAALVDEFGD